MLETKNKANNTKHRTQFKEQHMMKTQFNSNDTAIVQIAPRQPALFAKPANLPLANVLAGFILKGEAVELFENKLSQLTSREMEVLQLTADGKANKQTAAELGLSIKTVEKHREKLTQKLNSHCTADLTRYGIMAGIFRNQCSLT